MSYDANKVYKLIHHAERARDRYNEHSKDGTHYEVQNNGNDGFRVVPVTTSASFKTEDTHPEVASKEPVVEEASAPKRGKRSWKPGGTIEIPMHFRNPEFRYSFRNLNKDGRLGKLVSEGWEIDKELSKKGYNPGGASDGKFTDGRVMIGNLTLMRMHREDAEARKEYFQERTKEQLQGSVDSVHASGKVPTYGEGLRITN